MTPEHIYKQVMTKTGVTPCSLCQLHIPCRHTPSCLSLQQTPVINLDEVETQWHSAQGCASSPSSDALSYTEKVLCFVELKGWKEFLSHQPIAQKPLASEKEKQVLEKRITRQAGKYDLQRKLLESIKLCEDITTCNLNTGQIQIAFILITDVNVASNPLNVLTQQLNMLAFTTSSWEKVCTSALKKQLDTQIREHRTYFIGCRDFDALMSQL